MPRMITAPSPRDLLRGRLDVVAVIAAGGACGGGLRWTLGELLPHASTGFPWSTFLANVSGCLLLGVLLVFVLEVWRPGRYVRAFWGVGVLGGFTTFSAYSAETAHLLRNGQSSLALVYLVGSVLGGLLATWMGMALVQGTLLRRRTLTAGEST